MGKHGDEARRLFESGYNCAQSVFGAFAPDLGLSLEDAVRMACGFGGGIGRLRETCGAVSGMVLAASIRFGYSDPSNDQLKQALYARIQKLAGSFSDEFGSLICRELLGEAGQDHSPTPSARTPQYYASRPCADFVSGAADLLEAMWNG